ncbi:EamA family transporter [Streptomyces sp. SS8]
MAQCFSGVPELLRHPDLLARACLIGVAGTLAPFVLYAWGAAEVGAQAAAVNISLEPLFGAVLAWMWLGQTVGGVQAAGAVVMITAVVAIQLPRRRARSGAVRQRDDFRSPAREPDRPEGRTTGR